MRTPARAGIDMLAALTFGLGHRAAAQFLARRHMRYDEINWSVARRDV